MKNKADNNPLNLQTFQGLVAPKPKTFQALVARLNQFWDQQGCILLEPYDLEVGAGTFHPDTFLRAIGPEPWYAAHVQSSRRPSDGRYGDHPNRGQHFYQYQVVLKPSPANILDLYLDSLRTIGIDPLLHDIRLVEDNWESPTLGAAGLGWEIWLDGMEVTQFTYFQQVGGIECRPIMGEIAYGIERLAMTVLGVDHFKDLVWAESAMGNITYADIFQQTEFEMSKYNFEYANIEALFLQFDQHEAECKRLLNQENKDKSVGEGEESEKIEKSEKSERSEKSEKSEKNKSKTIKVEESEQDEENKMSALPIPAYELVLKASHIFNLLDARNAISVSERQRFILRVRNMARMVAEAYYQKREEMGFPLIKRWLEKRNLSA